ncbi:flagellar basal body P-ring formation chaperone FlgA [Calditrichota bacterium]
MNAIITTLLAITFSSSPALWEYSVQTAVAEHYSKLMEGKVEEYTVEVKRIPRMRSEYWKIIKVSGDEETIAPRGSRICWIEADVSGRTKKYGVTVKIETWQNCPVIIQTTPAKETINPSLVEWRLMNTTDLSSKSLPTEAELSMCYAKVNLPRGTLLTMARLTRIPVVEFGEELSLISKSDGFEITTKGKALQSAYLNEEVRVENLNSRKRLTGRVIGSGKVLVE